MSEAPIPRDHATARSSIAAMLPKLGENIGPDDELIILDEFTIERDWGWVFFYDSRRYHETRDFRYVLAGNAPFIVRRRDGKLLGTGTARNTESYIQEYLDNGELP